MTWSMTQKLRHLFGQQPITLIKSFVIPKQSACRLTTAAFQLSRMTTVLYSPGKEGRRASASTHDCLLANGLHVRCERDTQSELRSKQIRVQRLFTAQHFVPTTQTKLFSMPHSFTKCFMKPSSSV